MQNQFNSDKSVKQIVSDGMKKRLEKLLNPPEQPKAEKRPKNNLWIAWIAFNGLLAFLDLITAITVGTFTLWFYGVLVFLAGYGPVLLWEFLYTRPYASKNQKYAAIAGAMIGGFSTIGVGVLVGILNVMKINTVLGSGTVEMIIVISLIVITSLHVMLFGYYYFTDLGIVRTQKYATAQANHEDTLTSFNLAKKLAQEVLEFGAELETEVREGRGLIVGAALKKVGGTNILDDEIPELSDKDRSRERPM